MVGIKSTKKKKEKIVCVHGCTRMHMHTHTHKDETKSLDEAVQHVSVTEEWLGLGENGGKNKL